MFDDLDGDPHLCRVFHQLHELAWNFSGYLVGNNRQREKQSRSILVGQTLYNLLAKDGIVVRQADWDGYDGAVLVGGCFNHK